MGQKQTLSGTSDPRSSARAAGLVYTTDDTSGIRRVGLDGSMRGTVA